MYLYILVNARHLWGEPERECVFRLVDVIIRHYSVGMSTISCFLSSILALSYSLRRVSIASCRSAVLAMSVLFSLSDKHSFVSLSCPIRLSCSLRQASIASCHSAVLRLLCSLHQASIASCRSAVLRLSCSIGQT